MEKTAYIYCNEYFFSDNQNLNNEQYVITCKITCELNTKNF